MLNWLTSPEAWAALITLTAMEIVLGIDNIIFISILAGRLPKEQRDKARTLGLMFAMLTRILLLLSITWVMRLQSPLFYFFSNAVSGRDLILIGGGFFLLAKSTHEIHTSLEDHQSKDAILRRATGFLMTLMQIAVLDIVFSLDSVITAVGMADHVEVMVLAIMISVIVMLFAARFVSDFVDAHPTVKMLALSFLILIGVTLIADGLAFHIPKGYIYFAMAFSLGVECLNIMRRKRTV